jgi:polyhydroxyalkanoate synthesis repressor PhaR
LVLKKYGNRRLYNTSTSAYMTLAEAEAMVQRGVEFVVVDAKDGADLTKEILVQIILEREDARAVLPTGLLRQVIRLRASPLRDGFARMLQDGVGAFLQGQAGMLEAQRHMMQGNMQAAWGGLPSLFGAGAPRWPATPQVAPQASSPQSELSQLREDMSQTQAMLQALLRAQYPAAKPKAAPRKKAKKVARKGPTAKK